MSDTAQTIKTSSGSTFEFTGNGGPIRSMGAETIYLKCGHIISIKGTSVTSPQGESLKECCLIAMAEG